MTSIQPRADIGMICCNVLPSLWAPQLPAGQATGEAQDLPMQGSHLSGWSPVFHNIQQHKIGYFGSHLGWWGSVLHEIQRHKICCFAHQLWLCLHLVSQLSQACCKLLGQPCALCIGLGWRHRCICGTAKLPQLVSLYNPHSSVRHPDASDRHMHQTHTCIGQTHVSDYP